MSKQQVEMETFSPRSAASLRREAELRQQLATIEGKIAAAQKKLAEEEKKRDGAKRSVLTGKGWQTAQHLDEALIAIQGVTLRLETLGKMKAELEANIEAECVIPQDRAGVQSAFAQVALRRLDFDGRIEKQLEELRSALTKRAEFTRELRGLAERVELEADFDEQRFSVLRASLAPILPASERWYAQMLGKDGTPGLVRAFARVRFELAETVAHAAQYEPGEAVLLTDEQFAALSVATYALKAGDPCWDGEQRKHFTPRRVVSAEQFERDTAAAKKAGQSIGDFWRAEDEAEFQAAEKARTTEYMRQAWDRGVEQYRVNNGIPSSELADAQRRYARQFGARP